MAISTGGSSASPYPIADGYGTKTATPPAEITRVVPPRASVRARVRGMIYKTGVTAHTVTTMVTLSEVKVDSDAAKDQAVDVLSAVPTATDGSLLATGDWMILQHEDGVWEAYKVASLSGLSVTLTNLAKKVLKGTRAFFVGAPGDHTDRQYTVSASETLSPAGEGAMVCAATKDDQPILVLSNNITNAGELKWLAWDYAVV